MRIWLKWVLIILKIPFWIIEKSIKVWRFYDLLITAYAQRNLIVKTLAIALQQLFIKILLNISIYYTYQAVMHMHESNVLHRDIRASNIMLTREGEVKLVDFGLARGIKGEMGKRFTCIGSPNWMAPETVLSKGENGPGYGSRIDVWAIGITAIELGDGQPPFRDMHPTRVLFQIVRNPPPTLFRPSNWTNTFNDFIAELRIVTFTRLKYIILLIKLHSNLFIGLIKMFGKEPGQSALHGRSNRAYILVRAPREWLPGEYIRS